MKKDKMKFLLYFKVVNLYITKCSTQLTV